MLVASVACIFSCVVVRLLLVTLRTARAPPPIISSHTFPGARLLDRHSADHPTLARPRRPARATPCSVCPHAVNTRAIHSTLTHGARAVRGRPRANVHPCSQWVVALRAWSAMAAPVCLRRARIMRPSPCQLTRQGLCPPPLQHDSLHTAGTISPSASCARARALSSYSLSPDA